MVFPYGKRNPFIRNVDALTKVKALVFLLMQGLFLKGGRFII